jgi:membrane-bound lytic murein transglycosylase D
MVPITGQAKIMSAMLDQKVTPTAETKMTHAVAPANPEPAAPEKPAAPAANGVAIGAETTAQPGAHRVQRGETLFSISKRYGVAIDQLKIFNAMKTNSVQVGQNILLSGVSAAEASTATAPELLRVSTSAKTAPSKPSTYIVRSGDTLYAIAIKFAVELDDLLRWNKLSAKSVLQPGNKIRVTL